MKRQLGRYRLLRKLGAGAMAVVYLAVDTALDRKVAIKVIDAKLLRDKGPELYQRFQREARLAALLSHPNIVRLYDVGVSKERPFLVMEYLPGRDLKQVLASERELSLERKVSVALQIARALRHAHQCGVIHRDIKPANIRVLPDWGIKLMDFGVAKFSARDMTRLTSRGALVGSIKYMSPERILGEELTPATDVFAFGIVLYELLTGAYPFDGPTIVDILYRIVSTPPTPVDGQAVSSELRLVLDRSLAKSLDQRYPGFEPIVKQLKGVLRSLRNQEVLRQLSQRRAALEEPLLKSVSPAAVQVREGEATQTTQTTQEALSALLRMKTVLPEDADIDALLSPLSEETGAS